MSSINTSKTLQNWYDQHKRDLPWRHTTDPYRIWISEIILQQTRVIQGLDYYRRFIDRFQNLTMLANADEDEVLKYWQGLGYYSRARNLHKTAQIIVNEYGGNFPKAHVDILKLKGIGDYTAAAIASFAYNQPFAVVDGNVYRFLSRYFGIDTAIDSNMGKKEFAALAQQILDVAAPAAHNQSIMEFGALQCIPAQPDCSVCPLQATCSAYSLNLVGVLPVKDGKTKVRDRFFNYFYIDYQGDIFIQKRLAKDIWHNLYELPLIESDRVFELNEIVTLDLFADVHKLEIDSTTYSFKHILSHQRIFARFFIVSIKNTNNLLDEMIRINLEDLEKFAISRLTSLFFEQNK